MRWRKKRAVGSGSVCARVHIERDEVLVSRAYVERLQRERDGRLADYDRTPENLPPRSGGGGGGGGPDSAGSVEGGPECACFGVDGVEGTAGRDEDYYYSPDLIRAWRGVADAAQALWNEWEATRPGGGGKSEIYVELLGPLLGELGAALAEMGEPPGSTGVWNPERDDPRLGDTEPCPSREEQLLAAGNDLYQQLLAVLAATAEVNSNSIVGATDEWREAAGVETQLEHDYRMGTTPDE